MTKIDQFIISGKAFFTKRVPDVWVFGEWFGDKANDNSLAFANYVVNNHSEIKVYWVANKNADLRLLDKKIKVVRRNSKKTRMLLLKAGASFVNQNILDFDESNINYVSGSISVNFWHGIPWKHIFIDTEKQDNEISKLRLFFRKTSIYFNVARYWLTPSTDLKKIVKKSHYASEDRCIKTGYPRNAYFYDKKICGNIRNNLLYALNATDSAKIIAYMPTFRDGGDEVFSFESLLTDNEFVSWLENNNIYIIQKAHFVNQIQHNLSGLDTDNYIKRIINDNDISASELMAASDMLVTDYSSCFFDYLILDRPIIHFLYDYDKYIHQDRGVYYSAEQICCGDIAKNVDDLKKSLAINIINPNKDSKLRKKRKKQFINFENDHSCEDIYEFVKQRVNLKFHTNL